MNLKSLISLEVEFFQLVGRAALHTAFHHHHFISLLSLKYCWKDHKTILGGPEMLRVEANVIICNTNIFVANDTI